MPCPDWDLCLFEEVCEAIELVIDQGFDRANVDRSHGGRWIVVQPRQYGEKCRFGLARCRSGGNQQVSIRVKQDPTGFNLYRAQVCPTLAVDKFLNEWRKPIVRRSHSPSNRSRDITAGNARWLKG